MNGHLYSLSCFHSWKQLIFCHIGGGSDTIDTYALHKIFVSVLKFFNVEKYYFPNCHFRMIKISIFSNFFLFWGWVVGSDQTWKIPDFFFNRTLLKRNIFSETPCWLLWWFSVHTNKGTLSLHCIWPTIVKVTLFYNQTMW